MKKHIASDSDDPRQRLQHTSPPIVSTITSSLINLHTSPPNPIEQQSNPLGIPESQTGSVHFGTSSEFSAKSSQIPAGGDVHSSQSRSPSMLTPEVLPSILEPEG